MKVAMVSYLLAANPAIPPDQIEWCADIFLLGVPSRDQVPVDEMAEYEPLLVVTPTGVVRDLEGSTVSACAESESLAELWFVVPGMEGLYIRRWNDADHLSRHIPCGDEVYVYRLVPISRAGSRKEEVLW